MTNLSTTKEAMDTEEEEEPEECLTKQEGILSSTNISNEIWKTGFQELAMNIQ